METLTHENITLKVYLKTDKVIKMSVDTEIAKIPQFTYFVESEKFIGTEQRHYKTGEIVRDRNGKPFRNVYLKPSILDTMRNMLKSM